MVELEDSTRKYKWVRVGDVWLVVMGKGSLRERHPATPRF